MREDTPSVVLRNWLRAVMGPNGAAEYLEDVDTSPENVPRYWNRNDQPDDPKGHFNRERRWFQ